MHIARFLLSLPAAIVLVGTVVQGVDYGYESFGSRTQFGGDRSKRSNLLAAGAICSLTSGVVSYIFGCYRTRKKIDAEKKELLRYIKLQNNLYDVAEQRWKEEYDELYKSYLELKKETDERDYDEFKAPDADGDDHISSDEFDAYIGKYLKSFPELSGKDFPRFSEFDSDKSGFVTFPEWKKFIDRQKEMDDQKRGAENEAYSQLLDVLYEDETLSKEDTDAKT